MMQYIKFFILMAMVFCHIVDDYYLQGVLANLKQKSWWEKNAPEKMYKKDHLVALFMHGFSWSFMVHLPLVLYSFITKTESYLVIGASCICHAVLHAVVDHLKANVRCINLIQDQMVHLAQIAVIFITILEV